MISQPTTMFGGIDIVQVEAGTEIEHEGETMTVTDTQAVQRNGQMFVTKAVFDRLKQNSKPTRAALGANSGE